MQCFSGNAGCRVSRRAKQDEVLAGYEAAEMRDMSVNAACLEAQGYKIWDRAYETADFARRMGYQHLGLAFCASVAAEAGMYQRFLEDRGFRVTSVMCKTGAILKEDLLGLNDEQKVRPGCVEPMCNPIAQAALLAEAGVDLNVVMALCVGHDSIFFAHAKGPITVLVAKDRVYDHQPIKAIRLRDAGEITPEPQQKRTPEQIEQNKRAVFRSPAPRR